MNRRDFLKSSSVAAATALLAAQGLKPASAQDKQTYTMVTFLSGIDYWKDCYRGMQDAAEFLGVEATYTGVPEYDITGEVRVLEETIAQTPSGILVTIANAEALAVPINAGIDAGIPIVAFDADSPLSKRYSFVGTGNYYAGVVAARYIGPLVGSGKVAAVTRPSQGNLAARTQGFKETLAAEFPDVVLDDSAIIDNEGSPTVTATKVSALLQAEPEIKGIFSTSAEAAVGASQALRESGVIANVAHIGFDYDEATLDLIDRGDLGATLAQGTWQMGFWGMMFIYMVANGKIESVTDWKAAGISPLPPNVDTGVVVINKDNSKFWRAAK
ncbi:MAG: substrate-binding domain-containing protein [Anaerolineae bacterium]|nr:substrate-binding domain-containing protein [Anaerolineae bacterium]